MCKSGRVKGSHPLNSNGTKQAVGKGEPSLGSGSPSSTAIDLPANTTNQMTFEKLPRESNKAFAAFRVYLELGPQRSLALTAAKVGKSKVLMERWSRKYDWPGRVAAHAGYVAQVERETIEALAREKAIEWMKVHEDQRIQEWNARTRTLKLAEKIIARWERNEGKAGTLEGIARLLELASKLGRLASGMEGDVTTKDETTVRIDVTLALEKVYGVAAPPANIGSATQVVDVEATPVEPKQLEGK